MADRLGIHVFNIRRYEAASSQPTLDVLRNVGLTSAGHQRRLVGQESHISVSPVLTTCCRRH
jgi:hypothetical protein